MKPKLDCPSYLLSYFTRSHFQCYCGLLSFETKWGELSSNWLLCCLWSVYILIGTNVKKELRDTFRNLVMSDSMKYETSAITLTLLPSWWFCFGNLRQAYTIIDKFCLFISWSIDGDSMIAFFMEFVRTQILSYLGLRMDCK